jgi:hypothetical protein
LTILSFFSNASARIGTVFCFLFLFGGCLKDDFNKLSESEWAPDLAFPIIYSDLGIEDIATQKDSTVTVGVNANNIVEIIYTSFNYTQRANEILTLPEIDVNFNPSISTTNTQAFNGISTIGSSVNDSITFTASFSLDNQLSTAAILDTAFLKSGSLNVKITSQVPQNCIVRTEIPQLYINGQVFSQNLTFNSQGVVPVANELTRNLNNAYLIGSSENIEVKFYITITRSNAAAIPNNNQFSAEVQIQDPQFSRLSGYFAGLQMPIVTRDTMFIGIFRNAIEALELDFEEPSAEISLYNSTGLDVNTTITDIEAIRPGFPIPQVQPANYNLPFVLPAQNLNSSEPGTETIQLTSNNGSNIRNVVNSLPKSLVTESTVNPIATTGTWGYLLDTSRIAIRTDLKLPLDGLTLKLLLVDTLDFDFSGVTSDIESGLIRLNTLNGFPTESNVQIYFCRKNINGLGQTTSLTTIDSLFSGGEELLLASGITNASGLVTTPSQRIVDATLNRERWSNIIEGNADAILIKAEFTTFNQALDIVKVFESNRLQLRLGARIQVRKTF